MMKIYKFGGASVKDAESIKNVGRVLEKTNFDEGIIVVSAMGKTTNALEVLVKEYMSGENFTSTLEEIKNFHLQITDELFDKGNDVYDAVNHWFERMNEFMHYNKSEEYNFVYDQIVSRGELISSTILSHYLNQIGIANQWLDSRKIIKTDNTYREGGVDWEKTMLNSKNVEKGKLYVTQGFIGSDDNNFNVTLGREGSDYSAAIFAYILDVESMTIWKDVEGVLNADPRYFEEAVLLNQISYQEAVEMAFYGASVIHPKTLKPLENKNIPFYVKSFLNPLEDGTKISKGAAIEPYVPCFIRKTDQHLIHISPKDFSFISEYHMSDIFETLSKQKIKISMIQISAISLALCLEDKYGRIDKFISEIENDFNYEISKDATLFTIRHFDAESRMAVIESKELLLEQIIKETLQMVVSE